MDTLIKEILNVGGPLAVLVAVTWLMVAKFLEYLKHSANEWRLLIKEMHEAQIKSAREMHEEHVDARNLTREALNKNSVALQNLAVAVGACPLHPGHVHIEREKL